MAVKTSKVITSIAQVWDKEEVTILGMLTCYRGLVKTVPPWRRSFLHEDTHIGTKIHVNNENKVSKFRLDVHLSNGINGMEWVFKSYI